MNNPETVKQRIHFALGTLIVVITLMICGYVAGYIAGYARDLKFTFHQSEQDRPSLMMAVVVLLMIGSFLYR